MVVMITSRELKRMNLALNFMITVLFVYIFQVAGTKITELNETSIQITYLLRDYSVFF
jgi:hypothetical protein